MKINLKGIKKESVVGIFVLLVALINAILQMFGMATLPITNDDVSNVISSIFLIGSIAYSAYTNLNISPASQTGQKVTDAIKQCEVLADQVEDMLERIKEQNASAKES